MPHRKKDEQNVIRNPRIAKYYKSFVGRDFKALAQLALFVFHPYLTPGETEVWFCTFKG